ncbi:hypothetical protein QMK19_28875 [Streptomyces sp. H10-C2]|uniref:hypothetical protein n=1 Tax=unclassified Streptomyces TaxID=2593676 RepID=UPI0024B922BE|nr:MULTISPECIES: hypothetical protein [unclassified Streptomyces]MDJ0344224.1 hypothetical protein [Streptomyces sp. PH10-H1]MDJ0373562.1 hypothetical protein [Streptomyces sp. H10-C2]
MSALTSAAAWVQQYPVLSLAGAAVAVVLPLLAVLSLRGRDKTEQRKFSAGTIAAAVAFLVCTSVSLNTSYRFTLDGLDMQGTAERLLSCAAFESLIAMCVLGARERLASKAGSPGWYGSAVWIFAGLSAVPAWHEGGGLGTGTIVRIIVGSFGAALSAHAALGLELRHRSGDESQSPMAQIARDLRERLMSLLGLSQRNRTAQEITRDRALSRAVVLADRYDRITDADLEKRGARRLSARLANAMDGAGIADDPDRHREFTARLALRRSTRSLRELTLSSPWDTADDAAQTAGLDAMGEQIRHIEALADETERAVLAHRPGAHTAPSGAPGTPAHTTAAVAVGTIDASAAECVDDAEAYEDIPEQASGKAAAAHGVPSARVTARVPDQPGQERHTFAPEDTAHGLDLRGYATKRAALEALYAVRVRAGDQRTTNAITENLLAEMAQAGITLDRGSACRAIGELRGTRSVRRVSAAA